MFFYVRAGHRIADIYPRQLTLGTLCKPPYRALKAGSGEIRAHPAGRAFCRGSLFQQKCPDHPCQRQQHSGLTHYTRRNGTHCSGRASTEETPQRRRRKSTRRAQRQRPELAQAVA